MDKYGPIGDWDVSAITDMSDLFRDIEKFNVDISSWDTSRVTKMNGMFWVRPACALPSVLSRLRRAAGPASHVPSHLPADPADACMLLPSPQPSRSTRQNAFAFNQPLSFDTSSVTRRENTYHMFAVRSMRSCPPLLCVCVHAFSAPPLLSAGRAFVRRQQDGDPLRVGGKLCL